MADDLFAFADVQAARDALVAAELARAEAKEKILRSNRLTRVACWEAYNEATAQALAAMGHYQRLVTRGAAS